MMESESNFSLKNNVQHRAMSEYVIAIFGHDLYILCSYAIFSLGIYYMHLFPHSSLCV